MIYRKLLNILPFVMLFILLILAFECVNVESQYEDQSFVETSIETRPELSSKQKAIYLQQTYQAEKEMKSMIVIIKSLLGASIAFLILVFYLQYKLEKKSSNAPGN
ncbi:MAG: hypothetical protein JWR02_2088 [Mucilaginibacter sp.]|nr:hypothetical protein [Mucilaginibacter sp.]